MINSIKIIILIILFNCGNAFAKDFKSNFKHGETDIEKTTLYFLCKLIKQDISKRSAGDIEDRSIIEWQKPSFLIPTMKKQAIRFIRTDLDESSILERIIKNDKI